MITGYSRPYWKIRYCRQNGKNHSCERRQDDVASRNEEENAPHFPPLATLLRVEGHIFYSGIGGCTRRRSPRYITLAPSFGLVPARAERRRFSLALDLAEVFKPIIIDRTNIQPDKQRIIKEDQHFNLELRLCYLSDDGRRVFLQDYEKRSQSLFTTRTEEARVIPEIDQVGGLRTRKTSSRRGEVQRIPEQVVDRLRIITYDIAVERLPKVYHIMKQYLNWIQKSAFEGDLETGTARGSEVEGVQVIDSSKDCIVVFWMDNPKWLDRVVWGREKGLTDSVIIEQIILHKVRT